MSIISRGKEIAAKATGASTGKHQKNPDDYLLALDIGTEYVKALIAKKGKGALKIVGVGKAHEAPTNMYSGAIADIEGVAQTCEEALSIVVLMLASQLPTRKWKRLLSRFSKKQVNVLVVRWLWKRIIMMSKCV